MGRQAGVLGTPHSSLDQVEGSRRGVGDPRLGRLDRGGAVYPSLSARQRGALKDCFTEIIVAELGRIDWGAGKTHSRGRS